MKKTLALYIPVLHEGYRLFIEQNLGAKQLFLFDQKFLQNWPGFTYLKKDIRALDSQLMKQALRQLFPGLEISVVKNQQDWLAFLAGIKNNKWEWVLSNDDLGRYLAKEYLIEQKISFASFFLRWDRSAVEQAHNQQDSKTRVEEFVADQIITQDSFEKEVMKKAFIQANYSNDWWRQVGVVFVKDGQVLISAYNQHLPSSQEQYFSGDPRSLFSSGEAIELTSSIHAEALAIARAASQGVALAGADLFVTTFPCPICAKQVAAAGIKRLYYTEGYAVLDGWQVLKSAGIEICQVKFKEEEEQTLLTAKKRSSNLKKRYS
jgi:dCMP deaminase